MDGRMYGWVGGWILLTIDDAGEMHIMIQKVAIFSVIVQAYVVKCSI